MRSNPGYVHFRNLTRGLICECPSWTVHQSRVVRIQSTACEQKRWDAILREVGADFYYCLAKGDAVVVHDRSERNRETRACWQGLSWIRYATHRAWRETEPPIEFSRGGMVLNPYWEEQFCQLPRSTRNLLRYYRKFDRGGLIDAQSCYVPANMRELIASGDALPY